MIEKIFYLLVGIYIGQTMDLSWFGDKSTGNIDRRKVVEPLGGIYEDEP